MPPSPSHSAECKSRINRCTIRTVGWAGLWHAQVLPVDMSHPEDSNSNTGFAAMRGTIYTDPERTRLRATSEMKLFLSRRVYLTRVSCSVSASMRRTTFFPGSG